MSEQRKIDLVEIQEIDYNTITPLTLERDRKNKYEKQIESIIPLILKDIHNVNLGGFRRLNLLTGSKYGNICLTDDDLFNYVKPLIEKHMFRTKYDADNYVRNMKIPVLTIYW